MATGAVAEEGEPLSLLADAHSMLSQLARELGPSLERELRHEAAQFAAHGGT